MVARSPLSLTHRHGRTVCPSAPRALHARADRHRPRRLRFRARHAPPGERAALDGRHPGLGAGKGARHGDTLSVSAQYEGGDGYESEREAEACAKRLLYHHPLVAAVAVHPEREKPSLATAVEPIAGRDGTDENDCEQVAVGRLLERLSAPHPKQRVLLTQDGPGANGPHIRRVLDHGMDFLIVARQDGNASLFEARALQLSGGEDALDSRSGGGGQLGAVSE